MGFTAFKFHPRIAAGIQALGFSTPTPIQTKGIPPVLEGRDILGLAQTGTGKTAAFVLPILERLLKGSHRTLRCLILAPTRELAEQIHEVIRALTPHTGIRSMTVYGGVGMQPQIEKLRGGHDIVVACPGRLLDHFERRTVNVSKLEVLVLDEADRMFDMGFLPDIRRIIAKLPKERQTLLYSATMPAELNHLVREILVDPVTVKIGHTAPVETVDHALYPVAQHLKTPLLLELLRQTPTGSVLVFTRTKHRAKKVAHVLNKQGYEAAELQGNLSQNRRQQALDGFRDGKYNVLVATDIVARGIDVSTITHVINYDIPDTTDAYTHRIGRTGRMEKTGDAFTFVTSEDEETVRAIEKVLKYKIERRKLEGFDYHAAPAPKESAGRGQRPPRRDERGPGSRESSHGNRSSRRDESPRSGRDESRRSDRDSRGEDHARPRRSTGPDWNALGLQPDRGYGWKREHAGDGRSAETGDSGKGAEKPATAAPRKGRRRTSNSNWKPFGHGRRRR